MSTTDVEKQSEERDIASHDPSLTDDLAKDGKRSNGLIALIMLALSV